MPNDLKGTRVLVVDDDELICQLLTRSLQRRGYCVESETSPHAALERLAAEDFDVVLSDVNMDGLDGLAFTQRAIELRPDTPVILITGAATMEIAVTAVHAGAWDFLSKPIDSKLLGISMERACEHRRLRKELRGLRSQINGADFTRTAPLPSTTPGAC